MKNPSGYGSVVNLGKRRNKPYAVRITTGRHKSPKGRWVYTYKYLEYFEKSKDAHTYLANYNVGNPVKKHVSLIKEPTFKEVYEEFIVFKESLKNPPAKNTFSSWKTAFSHCKTLWDMKYKNIRTSDFQEIADTLKSKSYSSVSGVTKFLNNLFEYAEKYEYAEKNYSILATWEYTEVEEEAHTPFTESEIEKIRSHNSEESMLLLILIYTRMRIMELLSMELKNVYLDEKYMVGGSKTGAGKNRIIPIHSCIYPYIKHFYNSGNRYLVENLHGKKYSYRGFLYRWDKIMNELEMEHTPHDTRHAFATLADRYKMNDVCTKLIMGHKIKDITKGTYTHKTPEELATEINKIPSSFAP